MKIWDKNLSVLFSALAFVGNIFSHLQSYIQRVLRENRERWGDIPTRYQWSIRSYLWVVQYKY